jgi:hypothetical protein
MNIESVSPAAFELLKVFSKERTDMSEQAIRDILSNYYHHLSVKTRVTRMLQVFKNLPYPTMPFAYTSKVGGSIHRLFCSSASK